MGIPDPTTSKNELRRLVRARIAPEVPAASSAAIVARISEILANQSVDGPIALFAPLRDEPDLLPLLAGKPSTCWLFPRVDGESIVLHRISSPGELEPGRFGIREPSAGAPVVAAQSVRVFLCPGVAFDPGGLRLGRGGGYYDRLLADRAADALTIGVCRESQIVDAIPAEEHDIRMDLVVTERRMLK